MPRLSIIHTLLASFLLIAAVLGSASLGGLVTLEDFAQRSRDGAQRALAYTSAIREVEERTVDMERSARQFLVLGDAMLFDRFVEARDGALSALHDIVMFGMPETHVLIQGWTTTADAALVALESGAAPEDALLPMARILAMNEQLRGEIATEIDRQSQRLLDELDRNRARLGGNVLVGFIAAALLAALTGWWALRPLAKVERAIAALGESHLDTPIVIEGPSDLERVGRRLDWLRLRLIDLEANRARILRHVSHELKTPLASLREGIALMRDGVVGHLDSEQYEVVRILEQNCRLLQERLENLLGYNAAVFDARSLKRRKTAIRSLVDEVVSEHQLLIHARDLHVDLEGTVPDILVDPDKLRIVLTNLVANAVSFSPVGGCVRVVLDQLPGWIRIDCIDEGGGVPADEAERVFEPFFQGSRQPDDARNGSGLGLSIVREFVAAHGGNVALLPSEKGAHFRVELPNER